MSQELDTRGGFSLLELTLALAVFVVAMGAAAQILISSSTTITLQQQRVMATKDCQALLSEIRAFRNANSDAFPNAIVAQWPNNQTVAGDYHLTDENLTVSYANPASNPLAVTVKARWRNIDGHPAELTVATLMTDQ